jgi:hypothetical protein
MCVSCVLCLIVVSLPPSIMQSDNHWPKHSLKHNLLLNIEANYKNEITTMNCLKRL